MYKKIKAVNSYFKNIHVYVKANKRKHTSDLPTGSRIEHGKG